MCRYLIKLVCRFELNSSMNHSFHLMIKNVVYLDWSEKQNLSTLRKTYADDNNVVSSLRSLTTYHSLNRSKTVQGRGPVLYFFQKQLWSIFNWAQSWPSGRKKRFFGPYFFQSTEIKNRKNRSCVKCIRLPHCKILGHQVKNCKSL